MAITARQGASCLPRRRAQQACQCPCGTRGRHVSPEGVRQTWLRRDACPRRCSARGMPRGAPHPGRRLPLAPACDRLHPPSLGVTMVHHAWPWGGPERHGRGTAPCGHPRAHRRAPCSGACSVAAYLLALAQPRRRYQVSGAPWQGAVVPSGDGSRGRAVAERRPHAPVCLWGRGAGAAVISLARARPARTVHARMHAREETR
jgi:hypothetical protein